MVENPPSRRPLMPPRMVAVTYQAMPFVIFSFATDRDKEAATAEVKKGMRKPWQNLRVIKILVLDVLAQAMWNKMSKMAAVRHRPVSYTHLTLPPTPYV